MTKELHLFTPSKINLFLQIGSVTPEGMHTLDTVMQTTTLGDEVHLSVSPSNDFQITITSTDASVPLDEKNICFKAAKSFASATQVTGKISIHLVKNVPSQGGLGGGSGNAAGVLVGLNTLFSTALSTKNLCNLGGKIGKDIPFCIVGGTARGVHFGEEIIPLSPLPDCSIVICKPHQGVSTPQAFQLFDQLPFAENKGEISGILAGIENQDLPGIGAAMYNDFQRIVGDEDTEFILSVYEKWGSLGQVLSGSGSSVVGLFSSPQQGRNALLELEEKYPFVVLVKPFPQGPTEIKKTS